MKEEFMSSKTTFYFSRVIGAKVFDENNVFIGKLLDFAADINQDKFDELESFRPKVSALKVNKAGQKKYISFSSISASKTSGKYVFTCIGVTEITEEKAFENLMLEDNILDQQIVDINGRKVVRVNDIRLVALSGGIYTLAVDVGLEGLLRRIGIVKPLKGILKIFNVHIPSKFILFDDVAALDYSNLSIKLSKSVSKLHTLHPSDLADIIEDLGKASKTSVFSVLDEEKAADVLEEMDVHEQIHIIESLPIDKAADVLEKMPANEAADIIDELEEEKAELLLKEMEVESSEEVRELLEYPDTSVGSIMTTEVLSFKENITIDEALVEIRNLKPEKDMLYNLFVIDKNDRLLGTLTLRDIVISQPDTPIKDVMNRNPISVLDTDKLDSLAEIISKYNLLAVPVTDDDDKLEGMVVIDDVIEDLLGKRRTT
jgi:magnesium transporter